MRQDYWLFQGYLLGMGSLSEREECSHGAVELAVSFNAPMEVTVEGKSSSCSLLALPSQMPHTIDGGEGWQFFGYLHPESRLAGLIQEKIRASRRPCLQGTADFSSREPIIPSLDLEPSPYRIRELWEFLLSHLLGIRSYSLGWSRELKEILLAVESFPVAELGLRPLAEKLKMSPARAVERFFELSGIPLTYFLFNVKLVHAAEKIKRGMALDAAIRGAGLSGAASVKSYIDNLYGLDMENLLTEKPHVRFSSAADYEQLSGHALRAVPQGGKI